MPKDLITLSNNATLVDDFKERLENGNVLFVVLGDSAEHTAMAEKAADLADGWELAIHVPKPDDLYPTLLDLPVEGDSLPPVYDADHLFAVSIAKDTTICKILTTSDTDQIAMAYDLADTH